MKPDVEKAVQELIDGAPGSVRYGEDGDGGAYVLVEGIDIGEQFAPRVSWVGFHITWPYPEADVYPHFIDASVHYVGGSATPNQHPDGDLPAAMSRGNFEAPGFKLAGIQISRRSQRRNAETDTALDKLLRVIEFLRTR
ncbi:MAG: hypothetical protein ABSB24_02965 [Gaiellaceae bacterium]|jgi:hypothetical protein